jgi:long-chain acyl-CoA synthetase
MSSARDAGATREAHPWSQRLGVWWIAEDHPDLPAIAASPSGVTLTFAELAGRAHQLVHALRSRGFAPGDTIAYDLPNGVDIVVWQLATQESGLRSISLNPSSSAAEIHRILEHSGATGIALHHRFADRAVEATRSIPLRLAISVEGAIDGFEPQEALVAGHPTTPPDDRRLGGSISYSSGTTGDPKAIVRRLPDLDPWAVADSIKSFGHAFRFLPLEGAHLVSAGMHHGGCQGFYHGALNVGQALVIQGKFEPEEALGLIEEHRVTSAYMVPTQFVRFLKLGPEVRNRYDHSSLQTVVHSAAPCPPEIKRQMLEWWGPVVWETYGGMEGAATIAKPHRWLEKPGTVGRSIAGTKVRILDADGNDLPANEIGNVYLESPGSRFEYRDDPEATAAAFRGKAFTIGDVGYLDDDGYLFLCDRARDIIISGGVNIYPAEIEGALISHPSVADAAVIGVPDAEWGEQVKAVVELVDGAEPSVALAETLQAWCREHLAGYKCPRSIDFREQLPRREDGKLLKRLLRDEYWAGTGRKL